MSDIPEGVVNVLEMVVRCFDCWLSCAAHITVVDERGNEIYSRELKVGLGWMSNEKLILDMTALARVRPTKTLFFYFLEMIIYN